MSKGRLTRNRITCGLLFILALAVYIWTNMKFTLYLLVLMTVLTVLAVAANYAGMKRLGIEAVVRGRAGSESGAGGSIEIGLNNRSVFPLFCVRTDIVLHNLLTGSSCSTQESFFLLPREKRSETIELESLYIGRVEADIVSAAGIDAFGLSCFPAPSVSRGSYDRHPEEEVNSSPIEISKTESHNSMERYLHRKGNDPSEVLDIREYQRGDSVKRIHWKLSAKMGQVMVRELDMPSDNDTLVVFGINDVNGRQIDRVVSRALNVSSELLEQDIHHNFAILDEAGGLLQNFDITSEEDHRSMESRVLAGGIGVSSELMNAWMEHYRAYDRYSHVIYVTDEEPAYRLSDSIDYLIAEGE